jgi:hypothetical protein
LLIKRPSREVVRSGGQSLSDPSFNDPSFNDPSCNNPGADHAGTENPPWNGPALEIRGQPRDHYGTDR